MMRSELILKFQFEASHALAGFEIPHPHLWSLQVVIEGEIRAGKILDLVEARDLIQAKINPLKFTYLNDNRMLTAEARRAPTCETLSVYFLKVLDAELKKKALAQNPTAVLRSVQVGLSSMEEVELGAVRVVAG